VLRVFQAEGIPLYRSAEDGNAPAEAFDGGSSHHLQVSVYVYPGGPPTKFLYGWTGYAIPKVSEHGNVVAVWTAGEHATSADRALVPAAVQRLRYSKADARRPQLPTIVLHPGQWRSVDVATTTAGAEVDCVKGSVDVSDLVPRSPSSALTVDSDSDQTGSVTLRWQGVGGADLEYFCVGGAPNTATIQGTFPTGPRRTHVACAHALSGHLRSIGLEVQLPPLWYAGTSGNTLWIGNRPACAPPRRLAPHGIYLALKDDYAVSRKWSPDQRFLLRPQRGAPLALRTYGTYADVFMIKGRMYTLDLRLGAQARRAQQLRAVDAVLGDITRR
jgi:hypothetical protein